MKREADLVRRLASLQTLGDAVRALKSLSAHHVRELRTAVQPARVYREGVERIFAGAGVASEAGSGEAGLLLLGGELGMCGSYNSQLVAAATAARAELGPGPTLCVGHRAAVLLARSGIELRSSYAGPAGVRGLPPLLLRVAEDMLTSYAREGLRCFDVVASRFEGVGLTTPMRVRLLPLQPTGPAGPALPRYVTRDSLAAAATRELLYVTLYDLLLDALASEHGARLVVTQGAQSWLDAHTERLRRHLASARRESSTQEVIEIAAGARARARSQSRAG